MEGKIAIQGIEGSFHYQAAFDYFGEEIQITPCDSFDKLVKEVVSGQSQKGIMALENSIAGAILPNYALIDSHNLQITGEYYLHIEQNLMALPNEQLADIHEVHSHPMALLQCKAFFEKYPHIKLVEATDTAAAAKIIREKNLKGIAAIASKSASYLFELEILAPSIQTMKNNVTRFVIVEHKKELKTEENHNKGSIKFELGDKIGNLASVLGVMSQFNINLTKIQSLPVIETPWKYAFFVDFVFNSHQNYLKMMENITKITENLKFLGTYQHKNT